jgi:hypothetical protein
MTEIPSSATISTKLDRIATLAKQAPEMAFTSLSHHIDVDWLREAYRRTRKDGATGVDGQTATEYAAHLEDNLRSLLDRAKSGTYRAPPDYCPTRFCPKAGFHHGRSLGSVFENRPSAARTHWDKER